METSNTGYTTNKKTREPLPIDRTAALLFGFRLRIFATRKHGVQSVDFL